MPAGWQLPKKKQWKRWCVLFIFREYVCFHRKLAAYIQFCALGNSPSSSRCIIVFICSKWKYECCMQFWQSTEGVPTAATFLFFLVLLMEYCCQDRDGSGGWPSPRSVQAFTLTPRVWTAFFQHRELDFTHVCISHPPRAYLRFDCSCNYFESSTSAVRTYLQSDITDVAQKQADCTSWCLDS